MSLQPLNSVSFNLGIYFIEHESVKVGCGVYILPSLNLDLDFSVPGKRSLSHI